MGMTTDTIFGKTLGDIFPPDIVQAVESQIGKVLMGETDHYEIEVNDKIFLKTMAPLYENGAAAGIAGSGIDIPKRKSWRTCCGYRSFIRMSAKWQRMLPVGDSRFLFFSTNT